MTALLNGILLPCRKIAYRELHLMTLRGAGAILKGERNCQTPVWIMSRHLLLLALAWGASAAQLVSEDSFKMPEGFLFGAGTASYQTEGAWNVNGKYF